MNNYNNHSSNNNHNNQNWQQQQQQQSHSSSQNNNNNNNNNNIRSLIEYARGNYQENPTESLSCLLQALKLSNGGQASADAAMIRLRNELGDDIANHVGDYHLRMERAMTVIEELLNDTSTFLYQQGNQEFLRMSMEDGSSVVCTRCNDVVSSTRWQQHQQYWCRAIIHNDDDNNNNNNSNNNNNNDDDDDDSTDSNTDDIMAE